MIGEIQMAQSELNLKISTDIADKLAQSLIDKVKNEKIRLEITMEHDRTVYAIEPWEPFKMECPYSDRHGE